jgi:beta-glucosidase
MTKMTLDHEPNDSIKFEYVDNPTHEQIENKVSELLSQLSLDEKLSMMDGDLPFWEGMVEMMGGGYANHPWNAGVVSRLGIPGVRFIDGPRGVVMQGSTTFPVSMARGATWDVALEERIGEVIGKELRAQGGTFFGGVCINLLRHPAWGRAQETYGEDPFLLGEMGAALTRGVQRHGMACAKHYALNSIENARFKVDVKISPRALHEVYLPHFKRVVEEGVASVMSAYNSVNGEWCGQNKILLTDILKNLWGFDGFVVTDFIFGMRDPAKAVLAGQDIEMPFQMQYHQYFKPLIEGEQVPLEQVDDAVRRILRQQLRLLHPGDYPPELLGHQDHRALALEAARKSIVLLQNTGNILPLKNQQPLAVIGRLAAVPNTGDDGSSDTRPEYVITLLNGIKAGFSDPTQVVYEEGTDLVRVKTAAHKAEVVVLVVGYDHEDEGEFLDPATMQELAFLFPPPTPDDMSAIQGFMHQLSNQFGDNFLSGGDRNSLTLNEGDLQLIDVVSQANPNTIVVIMGGSVVIMESWQKKVAAILMVWYPGMEGGHALADILLGKVNPSGKLPLVIPKQESDLPSFDKNATEIVYDLWHGYRKLERDGNTPTYPFGYGLSYTQFEYSNLALSQRELAENDTLQISLDVTNTGGCAGDEVVQLYVSAKGSSVERAPKELKGFIRVLLQPGETHTVCFDLPVYQLAYYDESQSRFIVEAIEYEVMVGRHSLDDQALRARFTVIG